MADRFDSSAQLIDQLVCTRLGGLRFGAASAGSAHAAGGDALRRVLDRWAGEASHWARASAEIATALRSGARRYTEAESLAAARVG